MDAKQKKIATIVGIITGSVFVLIISTLIFMPKIKAFIQFKKEEKLPDETITPSVTTSPPLNPIGDINAVKAFQDWMDSKHPNWLNNGKSLNKGAGYGNYGSQTSKAWYKYSVEYKKLVIVAGVSGFKNDDKLYFKEGMSFATAYSYPSKKEQYQLGRIRLHGSNNVAVFKRDSSVKGWIVTRAIVERYDKVVKIIDNVFLESFPFTTVQP